MRSKLGFGIIGCGNIGPFHAEAISQIEDAKLKAVCDVVEAKSKELVAKYKSDFYTDCRDLLNREDVDIVSICLPSGMHEETAVAAAEAGKHIIVEKPLEVTLEKCDRIIQACECNNVKLAVVFPSRFEEASRRLKNAIDDGRFAKLVLGDVQIKWYRSQEYYDSGGWRGTWEMDGGGALMNQSIHSIDLLQWMMGPVESVFAYSDTLLRNIEVEDTAVAVLRLTSGALGVIEAATSIYPGLDARLAIHGEKGSAVLEASQIKTWEFVDKTDENESGEPTKNKKVSSGAKDPTKFISSEGHRLQIKNMIEAVKEDKQPLIDGIEGRKAVEIILAIYKSAREGKPVKLPLQQG